MAIVWSKVPDSVLELAHEIIEEHHPDLSEFNFGFLFRSEAGMSGGKAVLGQASKVSAKLAPVLDLDGLVWIAEDVWHSLPQESKRALLDHELCHFVMASDGTLSLRAHDINEFTEIIERYGFWNKDLREAAFALSRASEQMRLPIAPKQNGKLIALEPSDMTTKITVAELA